jgi:GntR family transcriptional regulator
LLHNGRRTRVIPTEDEMLQFQIRPNSDIPASKQLFDQIRFAIASRQYPPGHRLPSTRQLAMITGLHRNTISKVYQQLEESGLVESLAGSGIYVKAQGHEGGSELASPLFQQYPEASKLIRKSLDELLIQKLTLNQIRELLLEEIDWRLRSSALVLVTVPTSDIGAGNLILTELQQALNIPVELVPMEELAQVLAQTKSGTVVTSRYFIGDVEAIATPYSIRAIPIDIYDYSKEFETIKKLPKDSRLGIVSLSGGILNIAAILVHSVRGDDLSIVTAQAGDLEKLNVVIRTCQTIISDRASYAIVRQAIAANRDDLIRFPDLIVSENYIGEKSIDLLKRELGIATE